MASVKSELLEKGLIAALAELKRQERISGNTFETNGESAQVDGSFDLKQLVSAILRATG